MRVGGRSLLSLAVSPHARRLRAARATPCDRHCPATGCVFDPLLTSTQGSDSNTMTFGRPRRDHWPTCARIRATPFRCRDGRGERSATAPRHLQTSRPVSSPHGVALFDRHGTRASHRSAIRPLQRELYAAAACTYIVRSSAFEAEAPGTPRQGYNEQLQSGRIVQRRRPATERKRAAQRRSPAKC